VTRARGRRERWCPRQKRRGCCCRSAGFFSTTSSTGYGRIGRTGFCRGQRRAPSGSAPTAQGEEQGRALPGPGPGPAQFFLLLRERGPARIAPGSAEGRTRPGPGRPGYIAKTAGPGPVNPGSPVKEPGKWRAVFKVAHPDSFCWCLIRACGLGALSCWSSGCCTQVAQQGSLVF
jgi:hypothetical protein